ncbi:hypothetical protein [Afifella pfennigii]|uniref:hypothetical protein n=1 Tax=Afifella pfennigii TaxID=209897 RepID=UPI000478B89E|nr:hypothetical protein [Afifella pfennigii]
MALSQHENDADTLRKSLASERRFTRGERQELKRELQKAEEASIERRLGFFKRLSKPQDGLPSEAEESAELQAEAAVQEVFTIRWRIN